MPGATQKAARTVAARFLFFFFLALSPSPQGDDRGWSQRSPTKPQARFRQNRSACGSPLLRQCFPRFFSSSLFCFSDSSLVVLPTSFAQGVFLLRVKFFFLTNNEDNRKGSAALISSVALHYLVMYHHGQFSTKTHTSLLFHTQTHRKTLAFHNSGNFIPVRCSALRRLPRAVPATCLEHKNLAANGCLMAVGLGGGKWRFQSCGAWLG